MTLIGISILSPLFIAVIILFLQKRSSELALLAVGVSVLTNFGLLFGSGSEIILSGLPDMPLRLVSTPLTSLLAVVVAVVSFFVLLYAKGYMSKDKEQNRFFATMLLFIAAMQMLVFAGDWILLLSAWELIGLSSYLLIGFWYQKTGVKAAASRAFLVTRSADLGLYIAIFILIASTGSSDIAITLSAEGNAAIAAGILLLIAAMGKSAQTPFHDWLQKAMAGPTPVSALLHSATLVAAGAILLIRTAPMMPPEVLVVIGVVGGITALVTGLIALAETDLKRLLAASTSSQYGLMLLAVGAGVPIAALIHLVAHAAIKSSLFLGAGVFQSSRSSTVLADLKGVGREQPVIFLGFVIAALALIGIPPLSGFFSKDAIIFATIESTNAWLFVPLVLIGTVLTGAYMARAIKILWQGKAEHKELAGAKWMAMGMGGLVILVVVLGSVFSSIEVSISAPIEASMMAAIMGLIAATSGFLLGWFVPVSTLLGPVVEKANNGFSIAGGFDNLCVRPAFAIATACEKLERRLYNSVLWVGQAGIKIGHYARRIDDKGIDRFIFSAVRRTINLGTQARELQSGYIHKELAIMTVVTAVLLAVIVVVLLV